MLALSDLAALGHLSQRERQGGSHGTPKWRGKGCLLGAVEPLLNPVWVLIFYGEKPGVFALIGGVVVIVTITVWCIKGQEKAPEEAKA